MRQWIHTYNWIWLVVSEKTKEVHSVLWWRIMRHYKGVALKVELWSNIALNRQNHFNFKLTNILIVFLLQGYVLLPCMFFAAEKSRSSSRQNVIDTMKKKQLLKQALHCVAQHYIVYTIRCIIDWEKQIGDFFLREHLKIFNDNCYVWDE